MNSRYTYKAKRKDNGEWVYGSLLYDINNTSRSFIVEKSVTSYESTDLFIKENINTYVEIIPKTLCQCTGQQDMEGNYIFENDIIEFEAWNDEKIWSKIREEVYFNDGRFLVNYENLSEFHYCSKVIGNKFDEVKE